MEWDKIWKRAATPIGCTFVIWFIEYAAKGMVEEKKNKSRDILS